VTKVVEVVEREVYEVCASVEVVAEIVIAEFGVGE
jgi:hypothetical protein